MLNLSSQVILFLGKPAVLYTVIVFLFIGLYFLRAYGVARSNYAKVLKKELVVISRENQKRVVQDNL